MGGRPNCLIGGESQRHDEIMRQLQAGSAEVLTHRSFNNTISGMTVTQKALRASSIFLAALTKGKLLLLRRRILDR